MTDGLCSSLGLFAQQATQTLLSTNRLQDVIFVLTALRAVAVDQLDSVTSENAAAKLTDVLETRDRDDVVLKAVQNALAMCQSSIGQNPGWLAACWFYWGSFEQIADVLLSGGWHTLSVVPLHKALPHQQCCVWHTSSDHVLC